jgi:FkbM family methyltransferase
VKNPLLKRLSRHIRGRLRSRTLSSHGVAIVAQTKNGLLAVQPGDFNVSRSLLASGEYDWAQISWLKRLLGPQSHLVFAGAHIGAVLTPIAHEFPDAEVIAFEPSPRNFRLLNMNLSLNKLNNVSAKNVALGEQPGRLQFTENSINSGNSRISRSGGEISVDVGTLDQLVPSHWERIDLMVMDIEGSEVAAMRGGAHVLQKTRYLYVEFAPEQLAEQGSSAQQFIETVARDFKSAYVFGDAVGYFGPDEFAPYLTSVQSRRGLLLNILFSKDTHQDAARMRAGE